jgi:hypothetical protein
MKAMRLAAIFGIAIALAAPAHADDDTDFANQLHTYGIYGPRDYSAWLGKIGCDRLRKGVDANAYAATRFIAHNLAKNSTDAQRWQFFATAISRDTLARNETATFRWRSVQCQPHPAGTVLGGQSKPITSAQSAACSVNDPCPFAAACPTRS